MKNLYLFTARFPFKGCENFLEDEIEYLSRKFDKVYIVPFKNSGFGLREVPINCVVYTPIINGKIDCFLHGLFNFNSFVLLIGEFFTRKAFINYRRFKVWLTAYISTNYLLNSKIVKQISMQILPTDICYFYWGKWSNLLSLFWCGKAKMVSRFHGEWDLWEESYDGYAPLRSRIEISLNHAVFISQKGANYFHSRYPQCDICVHRLGTKDIGIANKSQDGIVRIVSCSTVYPLKRVDFIFKSILEASKSIKIEWTHLGGGVDFDNLKELCAKHKCNNLKVNLIGQVDNSQVLQYYKANRIDLFMNLSINEGVPVSIMEAISCDIPIVATNVGGNSEIVTERTGKLVSPNPSETEVANAIIEVTQNSVKYTPRQLWIDRYDAEVNYTKFAEFLINV